MFSPLRQGVKDFYMTCSLRWNAAKSKYLHFYLAAGTLAIVMTELG